MNSTISEKGQVTIPKRLRDQLGLKPGVVIEFENAAGKLVGHKRSPSEPLLNWIGKGKNPYKPGVTPTTADYLVAARNR